MEFIVFTSSTGINTTDLLDLFNIESHESVLISFDSLYINANNVESDFVENFINASIDHAETNSPGLPLRIVVHGTYTDQLVRLLASSYNNVKSIFIFDTPDTAVVQHLLNPGLYENLDACLKAWKNSIAQSVAFAEEHNATSALIDFKTIQNNPLQLAGLFNNKLGIQLGKCQSETQSYSNIVRLIAASTLLGRDDLMVWYDDAKNLALGLDADYQYTEVSSLLKNYSAKACDELGQKIENDQSLSAATQQKLTKTENELEIALLQINQLQEEIEELFDKYQTFEHESAESNLAKKIVEDNPLVQLLRQIRLVQA